MLYMPYSTLFVQENASKDKKIYPVHKISLLANILGKSSEVSPSTKSSAKFRSRRPNFAISVYFAISEIVGKIPVKFCH